MCVPCALVVECNLMRTASDRNVDLPSKMRLPIENAAMKIPTRLRLKKYLTNGNAQVELLTVWYCICNHWRRKRLRSIEELEAPSVLTREELEWVAFETVKILPQWRRDTTPGRSYTVLRVASRAIINTYWWDSSKHHPPRNGPNDSRLWKTVFLWEQLDNPPMSVEK